MNPLSTTDLKYYYTVATLKKSGNTSLVDESSYSDFPSAYKSTKGKEILSCEVKRIVKESDGTSFEAIAYTKDVELLHAELKIQNIIKKYLKK